MILEQNCCMSVGQKSRHINIRHFWISKDRTEANKITIRHCPTLEMLADFFTKSLQGNLSCRFRDVILVSKRPGVSLINDKSVVN